VLAREHLVEVFRGDEPEDGVAEELEALVRFARGAALDVEIGTVRQRETEKPGIIEVDPQVLAELLAGAALLGGQPRERGALRTCEQALEPRPESAGRGSRDRRTAGAAAGGGTTRGTTVPALVAFGTSAFAIVPWISAAAPLLQAVGIALRASVPL
jgi:hypothetical protein